MLGPLLFFALAAPAQAHSDMPAQKAPPGVVIGTTTVRIGMQVDAAVTQLETQYRIVRPAGIRIEVTTKGKSAPESYPLAVLYVRDQVVVGIEHDILDREVDSTDDLFDALFKVSTKLEDEGRAACQVDTGSSYQPGGPSLSKADLTMYCGPYRVVVLRNSFKSAEGKSETGYIVREELGQTEM